MSLGEAIVEMLVKNVDQEMGLYTAPSTFLHH